MADYNQAICVDQWELDPIYNGIYTKGTREKDVYFSPERPILPFIRPNHRYLLKKSDARYPWQFWMEIIAYRVGEIMGVAVPPAYVGVRHREEDGRPEYGALIEWFYFPDVELYYEGHSFMSEEIEDYDVKRGEQHNLRSILNMRLSQLHPVYVVYHWSDILTFDTIIGNRDRHQDNWGVALKAKEDEDENKILLDWHFSPAFDNGTALNHEILEENFYKFSDEKYLNNYLTKPTKARHHMKWGLDEPGPINFYDFMRRYITEYFFVKDRILERLNFTQADLEERLSALPAIVDDPSCRLTEARLTFTIRLIMRRRELLLKAISE